MIHRLEQSMNGPEDYDDLLALCRNEIPKSEAQELLVQCMWRLWGIPRSECPPSAHAEKQIHQEGLRELRSCGIAGLYAKSGAAVTPVRKTQRRQIDVTGAGMQSRGSMGGRHEVPRHDS